MVISGKELFACETAVQDFQTILATVGGPNEKARAELLLQTLEIVSDRPSDRANQLLVSARVKDRAKVISRRRQTQEITLLITPGYPFNQAILIEGSASLLWAMVL